LSQRLSALGSIGLEALDGIESGRLVTPSRRSEQIAALEKGPAPYGKLLIVIAPAIRQLIDAQPGAP
jgi:hypothetical protein